MRIFARGWGRDHGEKEIVEADPETAEIQSGLFTYYMDETYLQVKRKVVGKHVLQPKIQISKGAQLSLNGRYVVHLELTRDELARLFYLSNGDRDLQTLVETFARFKGEEE